MREGAADCSECFERKDAEVMLFQLMRCRANDAGRRRSSQRREYNNFSDTSVDQGTLETCEWVKVITTNTGQCCGGKELGSA